METEKELKEKIMDATILEFNENGVKFTMDHVAHRLNISKKTIYTLFHDKEGMLLEAVDYCFAEIKESEENIVKQDNLDVIEKLVTSKHTERIISEFESALDSREVYTSIIKRMEDFMHSENPVLEKIPIPLHEAWEVVENEGLCILPSDKAEEYFINEASLAFKDMLKEMLSQEKEC